MTRRAPRSTLSSSSAASDVYKRQGLKAVHAAGLLFLDEQWGRPTLTQLASHMAVIRSSSWLFWLHGHSDPLKGVHRLQPRGLFLVQAKKEQRGSTIPIQKLYHRAGVCEPKLAHLPEEDSKPGSLAKDNKFRHGLGTFLDKL
eukprot:TRINITY_DN7797_c0_g1_i3.p1 TRINITY_DN7797_c0_g1~~TRINITY_DN7797_c0_g1_i3.p1  ORF type:complete len:143 (-),score=42.12 TRINITY_DN7797_c0_g1_i3:55-483(-)